MYTSFGEFTATVWRQIPSVYLLTIPPRTNFLRATKLGPRSFARDFPTCHGVFRFVSKLENLHMPYGSGQRQNSSPSLSFALNFTGQTTTDLHAARLAQMSRQVFVLAPSFSTAQKTHEHCASAYNFSAL